MRTKTLSQIPPANSQQWKDKKTQDFIKSLQKQVHNMDGTKLLTEQGFFLWFKMHMCRKTMTWLSNAVLPFALRIILQINPNCKSCSIHIYWHLFCTRCSASSCKVGNRIHRIDTIFVPKTKLYCSGSGVYSSIFSISVCLRLGFCPISSNPFFLSRMPTIAFIVFKRKGNR